MSKEEYAIICDRIKKGEAMILELGGWDIAPENWIKGYEKLCVKALDYEIENDLLPI